MHVPLREVDKLARLALTIAKLGSHNKKQVVPESKQRAWWRRALRKGYSTSFWPKHLRLAGLLQLIHYVQYRLNPSCARQR